MCLSDLYAISSAKNLSCKILCTYTFVLRFFPVAFPIDFPIWVISLSALILLSILLALFCGHILNYSNLHMYPFPQWVIYSVK